MTSRTDAPIASRTLTIVGAEPTPVEVRIYPPAAMPQENHDFQCDIEIHWPEGVETKRAYGVDAVQALDIALKMVGILLYTSRYHKEKRLMWFKLGDGFGFPMSPNVRDLCEGIDKSL